jgi:hypothetical protein
MFSTGACGKQYGIRKWRNVATVGGAFRVKRIAMTESIQRNFLRNLERAGKSL